MQLYSKQDEKSYIKKTHKPFEYKNMHTSTIQKQF